MTAQLSPAPVFSSRDNNGLPLVGGQLFTYAAGTTTPQATYVDSTQTTPNTNPVRLNFRGEAFVWLNPLLSYKFVLQDAAGNLIWTEDNIQGAIGVASNIVPSITNTFTLGTPTITFANAYFGPNGAPLFDPISGNLAYYARTAAEILAGVTPSDYAYPPGNENRYASLNNAIQQMVEPGGSPMQSNLGGLILYGSLGASGLWPDVRPEGQLILANTPTSGHTIMSLAQQVPAEEAAIESVGMLSNGAFQQQGAWFWRWLNSINTFNAWEAVQATHVVGYQEDNTPIILWGRNSVQLCGGATTTLPWQTPPPANWVDVFTSLNAQSSLVTGTGHAYSTHSASFVFECAGFGQFGDIDGSGNTLHAVQVGYSSGGATGFIQGLNNSTSALIPLLISGAPINFSGNFVPSVDNSYSVGTSGNRVSVYFGATGTINTSDATQKTVRPGPVSDAEVRWGQAIRKLIKPFQWNDAITVKGPDKARIHFGVLAQEIEQAGHVAGIADPFGYAFLCRDPAVRSVKKKVPVQRHKEEQYTEDHITVEERNGKHIRVVTPTTRTRRLYQYVPLHDASGQPLLQDDYERDGEGQPLPPSEKGPRPMRKVPVTHRIAVMETVEEEVDAQEPVLDADGSPVYQYGVRYEQLLAFLLVTT